MTRIETSSDFTSTLSKLPIADQHWLAKRFIADVFHLANHPRIEPLREILDKPGCSDDDIQRAHSIARSVYVETGPHSDLDEVDFHCQATHFIAQAVLACTTPDGRGGGDPRLAQKVAGYCRMAQTCRSMGTSHEGPDFAEAEAGYHDAVKRQFDIVTQFLQAQRT